MTKNKDLYIHELFIRIKNNLGLKLLLVPLLGLFVFVMLYINWYSPKKSYYKSDLIVDCQLINNQHVSANLNKFKSIFLEKFNGLKQVSFFKVDTNKTSFIVRAEVFEYNVLDSLKDELNNFVLNSDLFKSNLIEHNKKLKIRIEKSQKRMYISLKDSVENTIKIDSLNRLLKNDKYLNVVADFNYNYVKLGKSVFPSIFASILAMLLSLLLLILPYYRKLKD